MLRLGRAAHGAFGWLWLDRTQTGADWCLSERKCFGEEINMSYWQRGRRQSSRVPILLWRRTAPCRHKDFFSCILIQKHRKKIFLPSEIYLYLFMMCFAAFANCCKQCCTWIWIVLASARKFFFFNSCSWLSCPGIWYCIILSFKIKTPWTCASLIFKRNLDFHSENLFFPGHCNTFTEENCQLITF